MGGLSLISGLSCGAGGRCSLDSALPWLWRRPAVTAPMEAWEPPFAMGAALKRKKKKGKAATLLNKKKSFFLDS